MAVAARLLLFFFLTSVRVLSARVLRDSPDANIYFSLMVSSAPTLDTTGVVPAVNKVLDAINGDSTILPGYRLQYSAVLDTQCNRAKALELYNDVIVSNKTVVAIVGCGCSSATEEVVRASSGTLPVISYSSTSVTLSDRSQFPGFFRTVPSDESLPPALTTLMKYYGWRQLSIITERETQFLSILPLLNDSLSEANISVIHLMNQSSHTKDEDNSRIFFLNTNPRLAISYLCQAYQEGRRYPEYIWITPGWYQQGWWNDNEDYLVSLNCSSATIQEQLDRSLSLLPHPDTSADNITEAFNATSYAMDAVMTLALALNDTLLESTPLNMSLQDAIKNATFPGASGDVQFNMDRNRKVSIVLLQQFRLFPGESLSLHIVAKIEEGNFTYINEETNSTVWPGSGSTGIPPLINVLNTLKIPIYSYVLFLVTVGVILCAICLVFNIVYRNRKVVKLTSPNLNYVIILGAVLLITGNVFVPSPSQKLPLLAVFCMISRVFLSVGYDICFVVALVKTIRVAYIFMSVSKVKRKLQDWKLLLLAIVIISIEITYTVPLLAIIYINGDTRIVLDERNPPSVNEQGYSVVQRMIICGNSSLPYFIYVGLSVSFKLVIHVVGLVLAFVTRKVHIDPLRDSRYSAILIYISFVFLIVALVIVFLVEDNEIYAGIWTSFVLLEVCVFLGLNFVPKMVSLYRDPKGEKVFRESDTVNKSQLAASLTVTVNNDNHPNGTMKVT